LKKKKRKKKKEKRKKRKRKERGKGNLLGGLRAPELSAMNYSPYFFHSHLLLSNVSKWEYL